MANSASGERSFARHADVVRAALSKALRKLGWEVRSGPGGSVDAIWTSAIFKFRDDIRIEIEAGERTTRVKVRSRSRVGRYDFGQNARHIRELFAEIDKAL